MPVIPMTPSTDGRPRFGQTASGQRAPRVIVVPRDTQRAYNLGGGWVICPVCSYEQRLPRQGPVMTRAGDFVYLCGRGKNAPAGAGCGQQFLYHPFADPVGGDPPTTFDGKYIGDGPRAVGNERPFQEKKAPLLR